MATDHHQIDRWETLPWFAMDRELYRLQTRIYRASAQNDRSTVRRLQKLLLNSRAAKLIAVRRVTQDNRGKNTPGVDGVCSLAPDERLELARGLKVGATADPVRRVYIPKPGTDELRPLGIPTMRDRALQTLVRFALEPEWEARFEPNSYGFRPGRSCWDAIQAIYDAIKHRDKYVLDADIAKCFDRIDHEALLRKVDAGPAITRQLRAWLKAGILDGETLFPSEAGTPQGGAISPLLANIALHGMEGLVRQRFPRRRRVVGGAIIDHPAAFLVRYADDFVVLHADEAVVRECQTVIAEWLKPMGLELKPSKTRVGHTLHEVNGQAGFDFLGFTVRQFPAGKHNAVRNGHGNRLQFKPLIRPSKKAVTRYSARLREAIARFRTTPQAALIDYLNPVVQGWANYYSTQASKKTFDRMDHVLYCMLRRWGNRRHPTKHNGWVARKYWQFGDGHGWHFRVAETGLRLKRHADVPIVRHVKVQDARSPFDGDWQYWSSRLGRNPEVLPAVARLLKRQKGKCPRCGLYFEHGDVWEVDHLVPCSAGGARRRDNIQLLHRHCHQSKTADDRRRGMTDHHHMTEEPDEVETLTSGSEAERRERSRRLG